MRVLLIMITCDDIIEETKSVPTKNASKKVVSTNSYILLTFLLIAIALLITVSIHLIKRQSKQKRLLPYHVTDNKLKSIFTSIII